MDGTVVMKLRRSAVLASTALLFVLATLATPSALYARGRYQGYVEIGGARVQTVAQLSTTQVQQSFPFAQIEVRLTGTATKAVLYSTSTGTTLANPISADSRGYFAFYTDTPIVDLVFSGGGISSTFTRSSIVVPSVSGLATFNIRDFGAVGDGTTDNCTAITNTFAAAIAAKNVKVSIPAGLYRTTCGASWGGSDQIEVAGDGETVSRIAFQPAASNSPMFTVTPSIGQVLSNGVSIHDLTITATNATAGKVGLRLIGVSSNSLITHLTLSITGSTSDIALQLRGHETSRFEKLNLQAAVGIALEKDPSFTPGPNDHLAFRDLLLYSTNDAEPVIKVATDTTLSNTVFENIAAIGGHDFFYYNNTTVGSIADFTNVGFTNIRWESSTTQIAIPAPKPLFGFFAYIVPRSTGGVFSGRVTFQRCYSGANGSQGYYIRNLNGVSWIANAIIGGADVPRVELDVDNSNNQLFFVANYFGFGPTVIRNIGNLLIPWDAHDMYSTSIATTNDWGFLYLCKAPLAADNNDQTMGVNAFKRTYTIAPGGSQDLIYPNSAVGPAHVSIVSQDSAKVLANLEHAEYDINYSTYAMLAGNSTNTATGNTASKLCLDYPGAGNPATLRNNLAYTVKVTVNWN